MKHSKLLTAAVLFALVAALLPGSAAQPVIAAQSPAVPVPPGPLQALMAQTDGQARVAYHHDTGLVSFIGTDPAHPVAALQAANSPEEAAMGYLETYGALFGVADPGANLALIRSRTEASGSMVRYQQTYQGVPVLGAELIVNLDAANRLLSASGEALDDLALSVSPAVTAAQARETALALTAKKEALDPAFLSASEPQLVIYDARILGGKAFPGSRLAWRVDVTPKGLYPLNEFVLVDAQRGSTLMQFNQVDTVLSRAIYDKANVRSDSLPGTLAKGEGGAATGIADVELAYQFAGDTYNFFFTRYGRDSLDRLGMALISTTRFCPSSSSAACPYDNAFWNGSQMVYGAGFASADDVVGHEMVHGITSKESNLFYFYQSGAINEALSDILGEFIDLTNSYTTGDIPWRMGEGLPGDYAAGIRDMSIPSWGYQPDKMSSPYYECDVYLGDNGGVHTNSGIANKAAYLMTAGGSFNGQTVTGIGVDKAAAIWYKVNADLLTSAADYADLANALPQACNALGYGASDCEQVQKAVTAVQMTAQPSSCPATEASVCPAGKTPTTLLFDDLETPAFNRWAVPAGKNWYYPQTTVPYLDAFDPTWATSGVTNIFGDNIDDISDTAVTLTAPVSVPATGAYLHFKHAFILEEGFDGGVVEISANGGASWTDAGAQFEANGYNDTMPAGYGNPLGGRNAFSGSSNGYISSRISLVPQAGNPVLVRFRMGTDSSGMYYGWFIDDVHFYTCGDAPVDYPNKLYVPFIKK